jgi:hypothetical protein
MRFYKKKVRNIIPYFACRRKKFDEGRLQLQLKIYCKEGGGGHKQFLNSLNK